MAYARILVLLDDATPDPAGCVARAASLAARDGTVHVVAPVFDGAYDVLAQGDAAMRRQGRESMLEAAAARLEAIAAAVAHRTDVVLTVEAAWIADRVRWLAETARDGGYALVVLPVSAGLVPAEAEFAEALLRATRVPAWLLRDYSRTPVRGAIVGAVDIASGTAIEARLAERIAATCAAIARLCAGEPWLVAVAPPARGEGLALVAADAGIAPGAFELCAGETASAVADAASRRGAALLVLGARLGRGLGDRLFGGTALHVLAHWAGDLLVVPDEA